MNKIAIIGGGPAGLMCAITAKRSNPELEIIIYEKNDIGSTLLPTGGGRCNLSFNESDIKTFAQNYPRGEKFLYSVFSQFFVPETIDFFNGIGIKAYIQEDNRIFPISNKSLDVIFALKNEIKNLGINVIKEEVKSIQRQNNKFQINDKFYDMATIATGGHNCNILQAVEALGHTIIPLRPSLCALEIEQKQFSAISGVCLKNITAAAVLNKKHYSLTNDLLFTHKGISGPLAYIISSLFSRDDYSPQNPIKLLLNFTKGEKLNLQKELELNSQKEILNYISNFMPKSLAKIILNDLNISTNKKCYQINKDERNKIEQALTSFELSIINPLKEGEIVSSGGISLDEVNSKTMESKIIPGLYFCGEILDIDGFCGGFNLQNCWSTGYIAGKALSLI